MARGSLNPLLSPSFYCSYFGLSYRTAMLCIMRILKEYFLFHFSIIHKSFLFIEKKNVFFSFPKCLLEGGEVGERGKKNLSHRLKLIP